MYVILIKNRDIFKILSLEKFKIFRRNIEVNFTTKFKFFVN